METDEEADVVRIAQARSPARNLDVKIIDKILKGEELTLEEEASPLIAQAKREIRARSATSTYHRK